METDHRNHILSELQNGPIESTLEFCTKNSIQHNSLVGCLLSLNSTEYIILENKEDKCWVLTEEGKKYVENGTPEYRIFRGIPEEGITKVDLENKFKDIFQFGFQNGMKKKWFAINKEKGVVLKSKPNVDDEDQVILRNIDSKVGEQKKEVIDALKKRKLISQAVTKFFKVLKGPKYQPSVVEKASDLTTDMIMNKKWEEQEFKEYNFNSLGKEIETGNLHPLLKVRTQFREILLEMGFEEMPTNNFVESSFWNFDSLFQPQQHPARDMHDTFFLSHPEKSQIDDAEYWEKVKTMHEKGGDGSLGWRYNWSYDEAKKNIFRTHTTAVSSRMLYEIAKEPEFKPRKLFSIDRVFRNETLDYTHLAEFHQIEGLIADRNIGLGHLKGVIREFFNKIGIKQLWFKPAYNPYTEPSMEIFGYHPILKKKVEIGNSGIFRPEMLGPLVTLLP